MKNSLSLSSSVLRAFLLLSGFLSVAAPLARAQVDYTWIGGTGSNLTVAWETVTNWSPSGYAGLSGSATPDSIVSFNPATPGGSISTTLNNSSAYALNNFNFTPTSTTTTTNLSVVSNAAGGNSFSIGGLLTLNGNGEPTGPSLTFADGFSKNLTLTVANILVQNKAILFLGDTGRGLGMVNVTGGTTITSATSGGTGATVSLHLESNLAGGTKGTANLGLVTFGTSGFANIGNNTVTLDANSSTTSDVSNVTVTGLQTSYSSGTTYSVGTQQLQGYSGSRPGTSLVTLTINNSSNYDTNALIIDSPSGNIATGSLALIKTGSGIQKLSGANTYTGTTTINQGTIRLGSATALGYGGAVLQSGAPAGNLGSTPNPGVQTVSGVTVNSTGTLDLNGQTINKPITLNGGALGNSSGTAATVSNGIAGITSTGSPTNLSAASVPAVTITPVSGGSGATAVALLGLTSASATATGGTGYAVGDLISVTASTSPSQLAVYSVASVSGGAITGLTLVTPGTGFSVAPTSANFTRLTGAGTGATFTFNDGTLQVVGIKMTAAGSGYAAPPTVTVGGTGISATAVVTGVTLIGTNNTIGDTGNITVAGVISGTGGFSKVGSDTVTFSGLNTYGGGTIVSSGILTINAGSSLGAGNVTVASGATLTLSTAGAIASTGNLILNASSLVNLNFTGTDTIGMLSLDGGATFASVGTWGSLTSGATYTSALFSGTGTIQVMAVPEPSTKAMLGLALVGLGLSWGLSRWAPAE